MEIRDKRRRLAAGVGLVVAGAAAGAILSGTLTAGAATTSPSATSSASRSQSGGPGVQENDGIPEAQEHHGHGLDLTGTVTSVGADTVTIKPSTGAAATYKVDSTSDIDKNGEAQLSTLVVGDAVRYSVRSGTTTIDKLHAGDETKDRPTSPPAGAGTGTGSSYSGSGGSATYGA